MLQLRPVEHRARIRELATLRDLTAAQLSGAATFVCRLRSDAEVHRQAPRMSDAGRLPLA
jgi:hypothetical protein